MRNVHILRTPGHYIGQVKGLGCRTWRTKTKTEHATPESAMAVAALSMGARDKRARVLFIPTGETGSYYGPTVAMELKRS